jgi:hypothetical protein
MVVKCRSDKQIEAQAQDIDEQPCNAKTFNLVESREYVVLGLTIFTRPESDRSGAWVTVLMEPEIPTIIAAPLYMFEVLDPRASQHWEVKVSASGAVRLWPSSFFADYYHDDLSERAPAVVRDFWAVYGLLSEEAKASGLNRTLRSN